MRPQSRPDSPEWFRPARCGRRRGCEHDRDKMFRESRAAPSAMSRQSWRLNMRVPNSRADAEAEVEQAIAKLVAQESGDLLSEALLPAFHSLASFFLSQLIRGSAPNTKDRRSLLDALNKLASCAVVATVSPKYWDDTANDNPHDEWWRFAPPGTKKLMLKERDRIRNRLLELLRNQDVPYWEHRLEQFPTAGGLVESPAGTNTKARMADPVFSNEHRAQFKQLLAIGEVHAINLHAEQFDFGPWVLGCDIRDHDTADRLKSRFRAAARKAAVAAAAPARANLLDWWIRKLARGNRPYLQGLIQRSIELCEEFETASVEYGWKMQRSDTAAGLRRDHYPTNFIVPYWLYDVPHDPLPDPKAEFDFWEGHIWDGFWKLLKNLENEHALGTDRSIRDLRKRQGGETRIAFRGRVRNRVSMGYYRIKPTFECLGFDLAVLLGNYVIDRRLTGSAATCAFDAESAQLGEKMHACLKESSRRLGLSWRKQLKEGIDLAKPFRIVVKDLELFNQRADAAADGDQLSLEQADNDSVDETEDNGPDPGKAERAKIRSVWLDQKLTQHTGWTSDTDVAANGGPSYNTIQRYRSGAASTRDLYVRRQLAKAFKCAITEVPA
jgi:hypothetical protein